MNEEDKKMIVERYQARLKTYGKSIKTLASGDRRKQKIRFDVLFELGDMNHSSILDVGCGFGDFCAYLKKRGVKGFEYTGYDIVPEFIELASRMYPDANFKVRDIQKDPPKRKFDYIISSQTFNNKLVNEDNEDVIKEIISICYNLCRVGTAIDMLTDYVDFKEDHLYYYNPEKIFRFCKSLTKRVTLRHDYPLYEFTVYLYKNFEGWHKIR